ncbi:hypothetical protein [Burkholderia ubonensis]|nr:hypothetical protein [Burkholderia ubonensis]
MKAVLNTTDAGVLLPRIDAALTTPWTFVAVDTADRAGEVGRNLWRPTG